MTPPDTAQPLLLDVPECLSPFAEWKRVHKVWTHYWPDADTDDGESPWIAVNGEYIKPDELPNRDGGIFVQPPSGTVCDTEEAACDLLCAANGWPYWFPLNPAGKPVN